MLHQLEKSQQKPEMAKVQPNAVAVEEAVLGAIMLEKDAYSTISDLLKPETFYERKNQLIFEAIQQLALNHEPIDMLTVTNKLQQNGVLEEAGGPFYIATLTGNVGSASHVEYHSRIVAQKYLVRSLINAAHTLEVSAEDETQDPLALMVSMKDTLDSLSVSIDEANGMFDSPTQEELIKRLGNDPTGIQTNYWFANEAGTDRKPLSIPSGALSFFCAPTSHGKSTFLRNLAWYVVKNIPGDVLYFTFEESEDAIVKQFINMEIGERLEVYENLSEGGAKRLTNTEAIDAFFHDKLCAQSGAYKASVKIQDAFERFNQYYCKDLFKKDHNRIIIVNQDISASKLSSLVSSHYKKAVKEGRKISAIFIDYIQLITIDDDMRNTTRAYGLKAACDRLRAFSISTGLPVICAAQLKRDVDSPLDLRSENISDASDIEKAANLIVCLWNSVVEAHNTVYYGKNTNGNTCEALGQHLTDIGFFAGGVSKYGGRGFSEEQLQQNKIYAKIVKWRSNERNLEGVFNFFGSTGIIQPNDAGKLVNRHTSTVECDF